MTAKRTKVWFPEGVAAEAAYTAHQAQRSWTEKQQSQSGFYIEKVIPQMVDGNNEAHIEMINKFLEKPIEFTIDRNSANDLAMRGMEMQVHDLIKGLPYDSMAVILNRRLNVIILVVSLMTQDNNRKSDAIYHLQKSKSCYLRASE